MRVRSIFAGVLLLSFSAGGGSARPQDETARLIGQIEYLISHESKLRVYDWIGFSVEGARVTLSGIVTRPSLRPAIERAVAKLEAVESVRNEIEEFPHSGNDIGMRVNAYWRIYGHPEIRRYLSGETQFQSRLRRSQDDVQRVLLQPVHILVRDGHITLEGEVEQLSDKRTVEDQARQVLGVLSVTNNVVVTGADTKELKPVNFEADPWWTDAGSVAEPVLRIENASGGVRVRVTNTNRVRIRRTGATREVRAGDTVETQLRRKTRIRAQPPDGELIDLDVDLPYGHRLEVETVDGPITLEGMVRRAALKTGTGALNIAAPWKTTRLQVASKYRPEHVDVPDSLRSTIVPPREIPGNAVWSLTDSHLQSRPLYGKIRIDANRPSRLILREAEVAADSPVRMHWDAPRVLATVFRSPFQRKLIRQQEGGSKPDLQATAAAPEAPVFSSDVRLVDLTVSVVDAENRPLTGLLPDDFEVLEDGAAQEIKIVQGAEAPFNLVLLLDCSTSTLVDRESVVEAARQFTMTARRADRVAVYVLADSYLHVLSSLTDDHDAVLRKIEDIPQLSGGTPLYDAMVLSYAHELAKRRWQRNALIVISDGMDNDLLPNWNRSVPSEVTAEELERAAAEMNAVIYPIFLEPEPPGVRIERSWRERSRRLADRARDRLTRIAAASGGRLFSASSIGDLDPVYAAVANELRSVYTLGYYPSNQQFDGVWRRIRVSVGRTDARIRTRPGYYGW